METGDGLNHSSCASETEKDSFQNWSEGRTRTRRADETGQGGILTGSAPGADVAGVAAARGSSSAPMYLVVPRLNLNVGAKDSGPSCQSLNARPADDVKERQRLEGLPEKYELLGRHQLLNAANVIGVHKEGFRSLVHRRIAGACPHPA